MYDNTLLSYSHFKNTKIWRYRSYSFFPYIFLMLCTTRIPLQTCLVIFEQRDNQEKLPCSSTSSGLQFCWHHGSTGNAVGRSQMGYWGIMNIEICNMLHPQELWSSSLIFQHPTFQCTLSILCWKIKKSLKIAPISQFYDKKLIV